jgi:hypothetical protein
VLVLIGRVGGVIAAPAAAARMASTAQTASVRGIKARVRTWDVMVVPQNLLSINGVASFFDN